MYAYVTAQLVSIYPKLDALISLAQKLEANATTVKSLKSFQGSIASFVRQRNRVVHDRRVVWWGPGEVARFEVSAKGTLEFGPRRERVPRLYKLRIRIDDKITEFPLTIEPQPV